MARARRQWSTMRAEIRRMLRETTSASSFWDDTDLLDYFNRSYDLRLLQLSNQEEGWNTELFVTDIVKDQRTYVLKEGIGIIKRVIMVFKDGSRTTRHTIWRNEHYFSSEVSDTGLGSARFLPDCRVQDNLIYLNPPPTENRTDGLEIEADGAPPRISADSDKIDLRCPEFLETLLVYDTWDEALGIEDAQGNVEEQIRGRLQSKHRAYLKQWDSYITKRLVAPFQGRPFHLGD